MQLRIGGTKKLDGLRAFSKFKSSSFTISPSLTGHLQIKTFRPLFPVSPALAITHTHTHTHTQLQSQTHREGRNYLLISPTQTREQIKLHYISGQNPFSYRSAVHSLDLVTNSRLDEIMRMGHISHWFHTFFFFFPV